MTHRTPPRYPKAADRGLSRVRLYRPVYPLPMRLAHQDMRALLTALVHAQLVRHQVLPPKG